MIHLPALSGAPRAHGLDPAAAMQRAGLWAVQEATSLARAGFEGLILENFGDTPFYKSSVPPETIACMSVVAAAVRESTRLPIGINVLRNDARAALAIASVTGCQFIRVNVLSGVTAADQGLIEGDAAFLLRERDRLQSEIRILADVHVKHALSLSSHDLALAVEETALRSGADGVIISGSATGRSVDLEHLKIAAEAAKAHRIPLFIGSGATSDTASELRRFADGIIVGSALRKAGKAGAPLDPSRVKSFIKAFRSTRR